MRKPISPLLFYPLFFLVVVLGIGILLLDAGSQKQRKWHQVAVVRANAGSNITSAEMIQSEVTMPLEKAIRDLSQNLQVESFTTENEAVVMVSASGPEDVDEDGVWYNRVNTAVIDARRNLTQEIDEPFVLRPANENRFLLYTVESPVMSPEELLRFHAHEIVPQVEVLPEVLSIQTLGGKKKILRICPDLKRLEAFGLDLDDLQKAILFENVSVGAGNISKTRSISLKNEFSSPEDIAHLMVEDHNGDRHELNQLCSLEFTEELLPTFSGRHGEGGKITGLVYFSNRFSTGDCRQNIRHVMDHLKIPSKTGVKVNLFDPGQAGSSDSHFSAKKVLVVGALCLVVLLVLTFLAQLRKRTKIFLVFGMALFYVSVFFVLRSSETITEDVLHMAIAFPPNDNDRLQHELAAADLASKMQKLEGIDDMAWYGGWGHNAQPFEACQVHYYLRPAKNTDRDVLLKQLYQLFGHLPGVTLTQFPANSKGIPVTQNIRVENNEREHLYASATMVCDLLNKNTGARHLYSEGNLFKPLLQYKISREEMYRYGFSPKALTDPRFNIGDLEVILACKDEQHKEILYRDMNMGGQYRRLRLPASIDAVPVGLYRFNGKNCSRIQFMTSYPPELERIRKQLDVLALQADTEIFWGEPER